ncbi:MAG: pyroglutamyl-peptidase I [Sporolactobacillus sp.]
MRILLSGFAPFGGDQVNPSWEAVRRLDGVQLDSGATLLATQLPVSFNQGFKRLASSMQAIEPDIVIAVGQASGRSAITLERAAYNQCDNSHLDNEGHFFAGETILPQGPEVYSSSLPVEAIVQSIQQMGIPAAPSDSAGRFVCNHVFYRLMNYIECSDRPMIGGFLHVPCLPEQTGTADLPSLTLEQITEAVRAAARVCAAVYFSRPDKIRL